MTIDGEAERRISNDDERRMLADSPGTELASNRTALSFQRTRMSADRTLMAIVRTSLSLIGFGFTIFQIFRKALKTAALSDIIDENAPRNFGLSLIFIGVGLLAAGIVNHYLTMRDLSRRRDRLFGMAIMRHGSTYRTSPTAVAAIMLLLVGLLAIFGIMLRAGPFG
jgi:putative membrane protein